MSYDPDVDYEVDNYDEGDCYTDNYQDNCEMDNGQINQSFEYEILKANQILSKRQDQLQSFCEFSSLSEDEATLVLIHFQWNSDRLHSLWFDDLTKHQIESGIEMSVIAKKRSNEFFQKNRLNGICIICQDKLDSTAVSLKCNHTACGDCWYNYLLSKIEDPLLCLLTPCPMTQCNLNVYPSFYYKFLGKEKSLIDKYNSAMTRNYTDANSDIKWCPNTKCGSCVRYPGHPAKEVACECGEKFCFKCILETHRPCDCEMAEAWDYKNKSQSANVQWLLANTKQCPKCHKYIEKNQGCNHMVCQPKAGGCSYEFCWICLDEWKKHGSEWYKCKFFDSAKVDPKKEKSVQDAKFELEKYALYFEKYINHQKAQGFAKKLLGTIQKYCDQLCIEKNLPVIEVQFLIEAVRTVIDCRITLKNTYIFGYYMKKCPETGLFEHNQYILDTKTDFLHEMMEGEEIPRIMRIDNYDSFSQEFIKFKNNVNNLMGAMLKFKENVLKELEFKGSTLYEIKKE